MPTAVFNILVLYNEPSTNVGAISEHLTAFKKYSRHNIQLVDSLAAEKLIPDLSPFDVVVLHNSVHFTRTSHLPKSLCEKITLYDGIKILFLQDEYREINRTAEQIRRLGIQIVFSTVNRDIGKEIYHHVFLENVQFEFILTGYASKALTGRKVPDYEDRTIDVSYRARKSPAWYGEFARQKWLIGERFEKDTDRYGLKCDISIKDVDRRYGEDWYNLVAGSKAVLGTEAGASFMDFTGEVQKQVEIYKTVNPQADFAKIQKRFLQGRDGKTVIRVISPRCFEAAALRTLMIMYEGEYSGILEPHKHYLPLARNHENMDEVVAVLRDPARAGEIIERAYREIACNPRFGYRAMVNQFERMIDIECQKLSKSNGYQTKRQAAVHLARWYDAAKLARKNTGLTRGIVYKHRLARGLQRMEERVHAKLAGFLPAGQKVLLSGFFGKLKIILKRILLQN